MKFLTTAILIAMLALSEMAYGACNSIPPGTDLGITITVDRDIDLGSFPRPDTGSATVTISTDGVQTLPSTLEVGTHNPNVFSQAKATITGQPNCNFQISVNTITGNIFNVIIAAESPYSFTNNSPIQGKLDSGGNFKILIGVSATVDSNPTQQVGGSFNVRVDYI